jgi:flavin-dependent dehydrogenase
MVGVGGINSRNKDMKAKMAAYVTQTGSDENLKYKGQYLPFGDYKKVPGRQHIILTGDAAGFVDPITGEGIALAMESGHHAAKAAIGALELGQPNEALGIYLKRVKPIQKSLDHAKMWRMIMFPKATEGYFRKAFERGSSLQMKYLELLAGEAEYADLRGALLRRIPKLSWRLVKHRLGFKGPV